MHARQGTSLHREAPGALYTGSVTEAVRQQRKSGGGGRVAWPYTHTQSLWNNPHPAPSGEQMCCHSHQAPAEAHPHQHRLWGECLGVPGSDLLPQLSQTADTPP